MQRRRFLTSAATAAASAWAQSPSQQVRLGVIGSGGRGTFVMQTFQKDSALKVGAICDVYEPNLENALSKAPGAKAYRDYRKLLEDRDIDAVLIATPEHWHHRQVLDALAAGKDVYVEKPLCQTPEQGAELVRAEKASKQIVQVGMQRRSYDLYLEGRKIVASGELGTVRMVRSWWLNNYLGSKPPANFQGKLDWDQWLGPAQHKRSFDPDLFRSWRNYADFAGGIVADQGAHVFDGIHLLMNASYPLAVTAAAGKPHRAGFDTPESVVVTAEYPEDFIGVFSINYGAMRYKSRNDQLSQLDGEKARMDIGREELKVFPQGAEETASATRTSAKGFGHATDLHVQNFLDCVRSRQRPTAPMELGFQAAIVVQMANLSLKHGRRIRWNHKMVRPERRVFLAGESPVRVSARAPGSRPQAGREIDRARAGRRKPVQAGSNPAGRNLMNAVASTDYQPKGVREGRAAHITAKATDSNQELERLLDLSGVASGGTLEKKNVEQERPYLAAKQ